MPRENFSVLYKEYIMKKLMFAILVTFFAASLSAAAECERDGKKYKTGDKVGPFTCMPDGTWKR